LLALLGILIILSSSFFVETILRPPTPAATVAVSRTATVPASGTRPHGQRPTSTPTPAASPTPLITPTVTSPIILPNNVTVPPLQLPANYMVLYEQQNAIYMVSGANGTPQQLTTPGYVYNEAVRPILTPTGQLLYSGSSNTGSGIWLEDIANGTITQIALSPPNQTITSMALSNDGTTIAWSTGPSNGNGVVDLYAGPLDSPVKVFEQSATNCPCFHVFDFMNGTGKKGDTTLLLTDDLQSHEANQNGLWTFDLTNPSALPQPVLSEAAQQGPLLLAPTSNVLLYSSSEGVAPVPTDNSVPNFIATLFFANSLDVTTLGGQPIVLGPTKVIVPEQHNLSNSADYHWITTPVFTANGGTIIYVEFNSGSQQPFDRVSAIFEAQISGSGSHLSVSQPRLMATAATQLIELGPWLNAHILTFYSNNYLYAIDIQSGAVAPIVQTQSYARIIAVVNTGFS
jgi:hypothetical protein